MKKILVPTDFTQGSLNAYEYALKLADSLSAKVTLFHVFGSSENVGHRPLSLTEALQAKDEESAQLAFEGYGYSVQTGLGLDIPSSYILEEGDRPVKAIVEYADFMEADFIVMGTWRSKGTSGLVDTWLGNVPTKVIAKTNRPVLLIPENVPYEEIRHIGYATNFKEKDQRIPNELVELNASDELDISVIHLHRPGTVYDPISVAFIKEMYRLNADNFNIRYFTINDFQVSRGLNTFIETEQVNILAILNHQELTVLERILVPGISQQMAFQAKVPLLILSEEPLAK